MAELVTSHPVPVLGVPLDALRMAEVVALCERAIQDRGRLLIGVVNAAKVVNMRRAPALRAAVLAADLILADGMAVVWAARLLGHPLPERVAGIDLMLRLFERAAVRGYRVYLLGATDEVLGVVCGQLAERYPGLRLVGCRNGYYAAAEEAQVAAQIAAARPDLLFVAMSPPLKEQFISDWGPRLGVPVCHGVGGAFDVLAGKVRRAPALWQRLGLEWLYRVLQEPGRLWRRYLETNTRFCWLVLTELLTGPRRVRPRHPADSAPASRQPES